MFIGFLEKKQGTYGHEDLNQFNSRKWLFNIFVPININ